MVSHKDLIGTAAKLEADARKLREAAEILGLGVSGVKTSPQALPFNGTRAEQLKAYLQMHGGSATRQQILSESGVPPGTVASLLGAKKTFIKDAQDNWHIRGTSYLKNQAHEAVKQHDFTPVSAPVAQQA